MHAFFVLAAAVVIFFIALLAGGALVGLAGLCMQMLRAPGGQRKVETPVTVSKPVAPRQNLPQAVNDPDVGGAQPAYA